MMEKSAFRFYAGCIKRALSGWYSHLEGWIGTLSLFFGLFLSVVALPPSLEKLSNGAPAIVLLAIAVLILVPRLFFSPYWAFRDEFLARQRAEQAREPRLAITLQPVVYDLVHIGGTTSETGGGDRYLAIKDGRFDVVALICNNPSETTAKACGARIRSVKRIDGEESTDISVIESVALPWRKDNPEDNLQVDIPPLESARIWVGGVRTGGQIWIYRDTNKLPVEYQRLIGTAGRYHVLIQVDGANVPPQQVLLDITTSPKPKPECGPWRGAVNAKIIAQGAPVIDVADHQLSTLD